MAKRPKYDEPVMTIDLTDEMNDDWLKARRLKELAEAGDKEAAAELERMENNQIELLKK